MWSGPYTYPCHAMGTQDLRGGLGIGEHELARIHVAARTEVTAIIGLLSFGTKCPEASRPCCGRCVDLSVVQVDMTRPFPFIEVVWDVVPLRHGSVSGMDTIVFDGHLGRGVEYWDEVLVRCVMELTFNSAAWVLPSSLITNPVVYDTRFLRSTRMRRTPDIVTIDRETCL